MDRLLRVATLLCLYVGALTLIGGCSRAKPPADEGAAVPADAAETGSVARIELTSYGFEEGQPIPAKYTCDGADVSPPLRWGELPQGTQALALVCDDPDAPAGTWVHWVIYNIAATTPELREGVPTTETLDEGALQGKNDFKKTGYGGPCPPKGKAHRYYFRLYALDALIDLEPGATKDDLVREMEGHTLGEGELMGTYQRK